MEDSSNVDLLIEMQDVFVEMVSWAVAVVVKQD